MAGNALEILQESCFCESFVVWNWYVVTIVMLKKKTPFEVAQKWWAKAPITYPYAVSGISDNTWKPNVPFASNLQLSHEEEEAERRELQKLLNEPDKPKDSVRYPQGLPT